ncbi:MAG TPA: hypothetical protein VMV46_02165 [Thermoanaerobaculia bacterium]|nr:hypothetical protein [Thermoanaerobaculia bacterium]
MRHHPLRSAAAILVAASVALPAVAGALEHTYPGAMCVVVTGDQPDNRDRPIRDENGQLFNGSPSRTLTVVCPIVGPFNDLSGGSAEVFVTDRNEEEDVCCQARLNNAGAIRVGTSACSQDTDDRNQTLQMTPPELNFTFTSRYFVCTIPPTDHGEASGIRLYRH